MRLPLALIALGLTATPITAQHQHSPYAGQENREIKSLSVEEIDGLLQGDGLGFAKSAELNGYPGPRHVLDMADDLDLTAKQRERTIEILDMMRDEAVRLGELLVEAERELDLAFAHRHIDSARLDGLVARTAELRGEIRFVHLKAHLQMQDVLTDEQADRYNRLRGYAPAQ